MSTSQLPGGIVAIKGQMDTMLKLLFQRMDADQLHIAALEAQVAEYDKAMDKLGGPEAIGIP